MATTKIEWADRVWNPITGCSPVSDGCRNCYARRMAYRMRGRFGYPQDDPFRVTIHKDKLTEPTYQKKPTTYFVCSMGDIFHPQIPDYAFWEIMTVIIRKPQHTFLLLTKRPDVAIQRINHHLGLNNLDKIAPNVWIGVSVENQGQAELRIPRLFDIHAAKRFVSIEPMLGPVNLTRIKKITGVGFKFLNAIYGAEFFPDVDSRAHDTWVGKLDWVICGGETGPGARHINPHWVRSLRDQCGQSGTPFFFKQWNDHKQQPLIDGELIQQFPKF